MRILHVHSGNLYGGVEALLITLASIANRTQVEHQFAICFEGRVASELRTQSAAVDLIGEVRTRYSLSVRRARAQLRRILEMRHFDAVVCHMPWAQGLFGPVIRTAGLPLIFWMHDVASGYHWLERLARRTVPDLALCNSRYTARTLGTLYPTCPSQVLYPPIAVSQRTFSAEERSVLRDVLNTPSSAIVIVQASRLEAWKGQTVHLQALGTLRDIPGWVCWIAGGSQRRSEAVYLAELKALAAELGIAERVKFCGERVDVPILLREADIYCQPNLRPEPFGIVFGEAMAAGLPIVATGLGGAAELVDATCGLTVPVNDPEALASALRKLMNDPALCVELGAAGAARVASICDPEKQASQFAAAIASLASARMTAATGG